MKKQIKSLILLATLLSNLITSSAIMQEENYSDVAIQELNERQITISIVEPEYEKQIIELNEEINRLKEENKRLINEQRLNSMAEENWEILCRVAIAEGGYNSAEAQMNVVWVVLNRVDSTDFPDSIEEVVMQSGQFSCVKNGGYKAAKITDYVLENVKTAFLLYYEGEVAQGALYFTRGSFNKEYLFTDEVKHNFYK